MISLDKKRTTNNGSWMQSAGIQNYLTAFVPVTQGVAGSSPVQTA